MRSGTNRASEDIIEAQNREYAERIASKTSFLKTVALDMESEAKDHHRSVYYALAKTSQDMLMKPITKIPKKLLLCPGLPISNPLDYL